jgi:flavin-dependent dehydrogenase
MSNRSVPNLKRDLHVVIVGGGPAGFACAICCAQAGLRTALLQGRRPSGPQPGETLHPGVEPVFERLGVSQEIANAGFARPEGICVTWNDGKQFHHYGRDDRGKWRGFHAWRTTLNAILRGRAQCLGVDILDPGRAAEPVIRNQRVVGVLAGDQVYDAMFVVDAAGGSHWLSRKLGRRIEKYSPKLIAEFGYASTGDPQHERWPSIIADQKGWLWSARIQPFLWAWTRLTFDRNRRDAAGPPAKPIARGADVTWRKVERTADKGYFIVGDAAAVLDPASSHGVLRALMTGIQAANAIDRVINAGLPEDLAAPQYDAWLGAWFFHDLIRLREIYAKHPNPPGWI